MKSAAPFSAILLGFILSVSSTSAGAALPSPSQGVSIGTAADVLKSETTILVQRRGAARRTTVVGPRGGVARSTTVARPGVVRPGVRPGWHGAGTRVVRPGVRPMWTRPVGFWWRPGGAVAAGAAIGFATAATAAAWAGAAPGPNMCWYYTDSSRRRGFWDACP